MNTVDDPNAVPAEMAGCPACTVAWNHPHTGLMHARCGGCEARAIAISPAAWRALHARTGVDVQEAIERVFGLDRYEEGRAKVWAWIKRIAQLKAEQHHG